MGMNWTRDQKKVIELKDCNILVSAAAGSGKTAVLVERIIRRISDQEHPIGVEELLVVTYTNAAAAEMRERIHLALEAAVEKDPGNIHLQKQLTLLQNAKITTIHSFCLSVIRNYFHLLDIDPAFRIAEEGELKLLKNEVAEALLEEKYAEKSEDFLRFVECYVTGRTDDTLIELILQLYEFSMSDPFPEDWLLACCREYELTDIKSLEEKEWMQALMRQLFLLLEEALEQAQYVRSLCLLEDGPDQYLEAVESDISLILDLQRAKSYSELGKKFEKLSFTALSRKKGSNVSEEIKSLAKEARDGVKKSLNGIREQYFYCAPEAMLLGMKNCQSNIRVLTGLVLRFLECFSRKKREKNVVDFHDLEQFALRILVRKEEGEIVPTEAAEEYAGQFQEIMIDEYQDSNYAQEILLNSVSGRRNGQNHLFMVGDVKQSIYRFRLAKPELFLEKLESYSADKGTCRKILLKQNFRSREEILQSVNYIFSQIMQKSVGNICYDEEAALYPGAVYPEGGEMREERTELLLLETGEEESEQSLSEEQEETERELEAKAVAKRIKELVGCAEIADKETGKYRKVRYQDIVVLLRSITGWGEVFQSVLTDEGIPAHMDSRTGYFEVPEVKTVLNLLNILNNPLQDIPFTAVLTSPVVGLSAEELVKLKLSAGEKEKTMYACAKAYAEREDGDEALRKKISEFLKIYKELRQIVPYTEIQELIHLILKKTGYGDFAAAMPGGEQRRANLQMLVEKAIAFSETSYRGLFHFVRYIEYLQKYEVDFGEAGTLSETGNTVRIMTIHKSKGLEFPVVFVSGLGKQFHMQDAYQKVILDANYGIGTDEFNTVRRTKKPTILKKVIQKQMLLENLGEELRVLYVALTRAKEKLILTGALRGIQKKTAKWAGIVRQEALPLKFGLLSGARCYLDWLVPALMRHRSMKALLEENEIYQNGLHSLYDAGTGFLVRVLTPYELMTQEVEAHIFSGADMQTLKNLDLEQEFDLEFRKNLEERLEYIYPYEDRKQIKAKVSVSELKQQGQFEEAETETEYLFGEAKSQVPFENAEEEDPVPCLPRFIQGEEAAAAGAARGIIYHKVLELLDFSLPPKTGPVKEFLKKLSEEGRLSEEEASQVNAGKLCRFLKSSLAARMRAAQLAGNLCREQPFVIGVPASVLDAASPEDEMVLIQGIIDVFFEEDGELVVADYKTDFVKNAEVLISRYQSQLGYYEKALEQITKKKVKEKLIYSVCLDEEIKIPDSDRKKLR